MTSTPDTSQRLVDEGGRLTDIWASFFRGMVRSQTSFSNTTKALTEDKASALQPFAEALLIEVPDNKDYPFIALAIEGEIEEVITQSLSGSCTVTVQINGQPLGGSSNAAGTTRQSEIHTAKNVLTTNDDLTVVVSSNASAEGVSVTIRGTRSLV